MAGSIGTYLYEKMNKKQNAKDNSINAPVKLDTTTPEYTKSTTPAGENRTIEKEDNTNRRKSLDKSIDDAEK